MRQLGENPADFERLRASLIRALKPQDGMEQMLVEEMAENRWRAFRLRRAESGILTSRRREFELDREWQGHLARRQMGTYFEVPETAIKGWVNAPDCPAKYAEILRQLRFLRDLHWLKGFGESHLTALDLIYGSEGSGLGNNLLSLCELGMKDLEKQDPEDKALKSKMFLEALDEETKFFEREWELYQSKNLCLSDEMRDTQMLPRQKDLDKIIRYEAALDRQFERKWQQLMAWRRAKGSPVPPQIVEPYVEER